MRCFAVERDDLIESRNLSKRMGVANSASLDAVCGQIERSKLRWNTRLATEWERETDLRGRLRHNRVEKENDLEKAVKKVVFHDMKYDCVHEVCFPLKDTRNKKGEFISRSRSPDFVLSGMKVDNKFVDLDPHHFCVDDNGKAESAQVERWVEFKRMWGNNFYIVFISHNSEKEVEKQTGMCCDAFCDVFLHVGRKGEKTDEQTRQMIKGFLKDLAELSAEQGGFSSPQRASEDYEFLEILKRAERGKVVQRYLNTSKVSEAAAITIFRATGEQQ
jgi:hypothetical protein